MDLQSMANGQIRKLWMYYKISKLFKQLGALLIAIFPHAVRETARSNGSGLLQ
jgi:hypothetical protein